MNVLDETNAKGKRVLVLGTTGGVGHLAVQILNAWGAKVWGICNSNAEKWMKQNKIECEQLYFYDNIEGCPLDQLEGKVDLVFNCSGVENDIYPYKNIVNCLIPGGWYVTLNTTLFKHCETKTPIRAYAAAGKDHKKMRKWFKQHGCNAKWGIFNDRFASFDLDRLKSLVDSGQLRPVLTGISQIQNSKELFIQYSKDSARGKMVIDLSQKK